MEIIQDTSMRSAADAFGALDDTPAATVEQDDIRDEDDAGQPLDDESGEEHNGADVEGEQPDTPADEQDEEPEAPAIEPPVSWDAAAKAEFAALSPALQATVAKRESDRERFVQAKATEAAQHRKAAEAVTAEYTQLHRQFAEQLDTYAQQFQPQRPNPAMIATDPVGYSQAMAYYEQDKAQREEIEQQSAQARQRAASVEQYQAQQQQQADHEMLLEAIPEWGDHSKQTEILASVVAAARELGWPDDLIQQARPHDILAVRKAAEWKAKSDKWDQLNKSKMEPVRAAKSLPKVSRPGAAQPKGSARAQGLQDDLTRLRSSGDVRDAAVAFGKLAR